MPIIVNGVNMRHDEQVTTSKTTPRTRYHHGDLRNAMMESAVELARTGGPDAVVLREVARRVGVSATAAYRHFSDAEALLDEVKRSALEVLAEAMAAAVARVPVDGDPGDVAVARLRAVAHAYIDFAVEQSGLFMTAFCRTNTVPGHEYGGEPYNETEAFRGLGALLDALVATGRMAAERRPGADIAAWSMVHGFALLLVDGPLQRHLSAEEQDFALERTVDVIVRGLTAGE
ncbi:AcrR family transcriptional regulator [Catenulispora sp. GAS73]